MAERVVEKIQSIMPEAKLEDLTYGFKIHLPRPVKTMERYQDLKNALKDLDNVPICIYCLDSKTRFRYFNNSSSTVLQARYRCTNCLRDFTLGGRQNQKKISIPLGDQDKRSKRAHEDHLSQLELERNRIRGSDNAINQGIVAFTSHQCQGRKSMAGSYIGSMEETLDFCGEKRALCQFEILGIERPDMNNAPYR